VGAYPRKWSVAALSPHKQRPELYRTLDRYDFPDFSLFISRFVSLAWWRRYSPFPGIAELARFLYFYAIGRGQGHVQSVIISSGLLAMAMMVFIGGMISDVIAANRVLLEDIRTRLLQRAVSEAIDSTRLPDWPTSDKPSGISR
jgi:hypothetical protein